MIQFDVFAQSAQGYEVHFQIQGDKVYDDALRLLEKLEADGFKARAMNGYKGHHSKAAQNGNGDSAHRCEKHNVDYRRYFKGERVWYAHQTDDGEWCKERKG